MESSSGSSIVSITDNSIQVQTPTTRTISLNGGYLLFTGRYWGSVGYTYELEGDIDAFRIEKAHKYNHPEKIAAGMCGGDDGMLSFTLTPTTKGKFTIVEICKFRGEVTKRVNNTIIVK